MSNRSETFLIQLSSHATFTQTRWHVQKMWWKFIYLTVQLDPAINPLWWPMAISYLISKTSFNGTFMRDSGICKMTHFVQKSTLNFYWNHDELTGMEFADMTSLVNLSAFFLLPITILDMEREASKKVRSRNRNFVMWPPPIFMLQGVQD